MEREHGTWNREPGFGFLDFWEQGFGILKIMHYELCIKKKSRHCLIAAPILIFNCQFSTLNFYLSSSSNHASIDLSSSNSSCFGSSK